MDEPVCVIGERIQALFALMPWQCSRRDWPFSLFSSSSRTEVSFLIQEIKRAQTLGSQVPQLIIIQFSEETRLVTTAKKKQGDISLRAKWQSSNKLFSVEVSMWSHISFNLPTRVQNFQWFNSIYWPYIKEFIWFWCCWYFCFTFHLHLGNAVNSFSQGFYS